ncbi:hypothetical protein NFC81_13465 [Salinispirillum sp. LH 10-3-1]|uniref:Uncharacterized protein n=1 Tax=Salinispirillum sp. LH 10-3-1 TaxID=2952525 RepID=A0AB38YEB8_9GAMM
MWKLLERLVRSPNIIVVALCVLFLTVLSATIVVWPNQQLLANSWHQQGELLAREYGHRAAGLLTIDDRISLTVEARRWTREPLITGLEILDPAGRTITDAGSVTGDDHRSFSSPLYYEEQLLGTLTLWQDDSNLRAARLRGTLLIALTLIVFGGLSAGMMHLYLRRQGHDSQTVQALLLAHFPELHAPATLEPQARLNHLLRQLGRSHGDALDLLSALRRRLPEHQISEIISNFRASDLPGAQTVGALIKIELVNLDALEKKLPPDAVKRLMDFIQQRCDEVMRLYQGEPTQDPWRFLVQNDIEDGDFVQRALCASYVLDQLLNNMEGWTARPRPEFSVSVMAGPMYAGIQNSRGLPVLTIFGQILKQLDALSSHNQGAQILIGEPVFQYAPLGEIVDAEIYRDIALPDTQTLEVWRLLGFTENWQRVLDRQVDSLQDRV